MNRLPRPQGATHLSLSYQSSNQEEDKQALYRHIVTAYTLNGFTWNGKPMSIPELSHLLNIPTTDIMAGVSAFGTNMGNLATPENIEETLKSIITLSTSWAIQDRGQVQHQLSQMLTAQGNGYKPFISAEVNKSLKLILESNKNLMETYKTFFTSTNNTTNILNIQARDAKEDIDYLSPDRALELILNKGQTDQPSLPANTLGSQESEFSGEADKLYQEYGMEGFVNVRENRSGTEALMALEPQGPGAKEPSSQHVRYPKADEDGGFERRGMEVEDVDELP